MARSDSLNISTSTPCSQLADRNQRRRSGTEATLQGFFGSVVAIVLGTYIGWLYIKYSLVDSLGWVILFHLAVGSVIAVLITGIAVAVIAGYLPSKKAGGLVITEALDFE